MPRAKNGKQQQRRKSRGQPSGILPPSAAAYHGPIKQPVSDQYHTIAFGITPLQVSTGATGVTTGVVTTAGVNSCTDWGVVSSLWAEYRVLGIKVEYLPSIAESSGTCAVGYITSVHQSGLALPAGAGDLVNSPGRRFVNFGKRWTQEWKMSGTDESGFSTIATLPNHGGIAWYGQFGPASQVAGYYTATYLVQFRAQL